MSMGSILPKYGKAEGERRRRRRPWRVVLWEFARLRLTVWLLIVMGVTMIVGSIFPQGYDADTYIASWGEARYEALARWGLLNIFHSKFFLALGTLLLLNLVACSLVRWFGRRGAGLAGETAPPHAREVRLTGTADRAGVESALRSRGYKILASREGLVTARRGPWPEGVSLLYHLAMAAAIIGFIISALFSFEGDVTLWPGEPVEVRTVRAGTGAYRLREALSSWSLGDWHPFAAAAPDTSGWSDRSVTIELDEFVTEWELYESRFYPKDWLSELTVTDDEGSTREALVEVNRPLRASGLTFYQMAYEQQFDVVVSRDGEIVERMEAQSYVPFTLESIGGMFFPGTLRVGTLFEKYHDARPIVPHTPLRWQPPPDTTAVAAGDSTAPEDASPGAPAERVELGDLSAGAPLDVEGLSLTLENPREASILSYRHDPAVPLLYIAIIAFMVGLAIRIYWPSYRVQLWIEEGAGGVTGRLVFRATGMLGEPEAIEEELVAALSR